jgi:hypothetical protein
MVIGVPFPILANQVNYFERKKCITNEESKEIGVCMTGT